MNCSEESLLRILDQHGGVVASGRHSSQYADPSCPLCVLEMHAWCLWEQGVISVITDNPMTLGRPDYRFINDACWSSREIATPHLIRLHLAYEGWSEWGNERRLAIVTKIIIETVRQIIAELSWLPDKIRDQCKSVTDLSSVGDAARAASNARAIRVAYSSRFAARAADVADIVSANVADSAFAATTANDVTRAAAYAARSAARAALVSCSNADDILITAVNIWVNAKELI